MFITSREKAIIDLIVKSSGKHTVQTLANYLNVSSRTIHRDLKAVEKVLNHFELQLRRNTNNGYTIDGKNEHIYRLIQFITEVHPTDETSEERKLQILIKLLHAKDVIKKVVLAKQLGVSIATLTAYLDDLEGWLENFSIRITRTRGVGIELNGEEANKRNALASYFLLHFHEDLLESLYLLQKGQPFPYPVQGYFTPAYLLKIDEVAHRFLAKQQTRLADQDYLRLIVHIAITVQRNENQFLIKSVTDSKESTREFRIMYQLCETIKNEISASFTQQDIEYLSVVLRGSKLQNTTQLDYDRILLGQIIKNLIQGVSEQLNIDLTKDFSLFQGLLAHLEPSIFRLKHQMGSFNPLTDEIKHKYPVLFMAVKNGLTKEFKDLDFPEDEVAFIVLHFGSALLMNEEKVAIRAVVVCPTGIGTSRMLASRIRKEIDEIQSVEIKSIQDFESSKRDDYDLIISTVRLPFSDVDYILVSALLNEEDINVIRNYLQSNLQNLTSRNKYMKSPEKEFSISKPKQSTFQDVLSEMKNVVTSVESILNNLRIFRKSNEDYIQVLDEMVHELEREGLLIDSSGVLQRIKEREEMGGLGIPQTSMGLYHCRHESVKSLIFQISHLHHPCVIRGMDGKNMLMKDLLLMLSPEKLSQKEQEILSLISTSLIENDMSMMIFSSSNEALIKQKLESIFLDYIES